MLTERQRDGLIATYVGLKHSYGRDEAMGIIGMFSEDAAGVRAAVERARQRADQEYALANYGEERRLREISDDLVILADRIDAGDGKEEERPCW